MEAFRPLKNPDSATEIHHRPRHDTSHVLVLGRVRLYGELRYRSITVGITELRQTVGLLLDSLMPVYCNDLAVQKVLPVNHLSDTGLPVVTAELLQLKGFNRCGYLNIGVQDGTGDTVGVRVMFLRHVLGDAETLGGTTIRGVDIVTSLVSEIRRAGYCRS